MNEQLSLFAQSAPTAPPDAGLPDEAARRRIREDLDTSLLVEAGAGAGKTTEMVRRMVALVRSGRAQVQQIAAVTFTRKAAAELRERFQTAIEKELQHALAAGDGAAGVLLDAALRDIDRAFLGTIHAFCARLLRERPLEAGIDPAFRELLGAEERRQGEAFWRHHVERALVEGSASLDALRGAGLEPSQVKGLFDELVEQPDVEYPSVATPRPGTDGLRARLMPLIMQAESLMPAREPRQGWDALQRSIRTLCFHRDVVGWDDDGVFLDVLAGFTENSWDVRRRHWEQPEPAREVSRQFAALWAAGGAADALLRQWWAHRYPIALQFAREAARAYDTERRRAGMLNFQDLLMFAARLLRESPAARRELSDRYRFLLVDEFQDTDPVQAEVLFLLASDEELDLFGGDDDDAPREFAPPLASWRHLVPRPGALFVVGDPKQSIYRFRRADMTLYTLVRQRFASWEEAGIGAVVELTSNFRSRLPIAGFVNEAFRTRFDGTGSDMQAPFAPMLVRPAETAPPAEGVFWYELSDPTANAARIVHEDAARLATWIEGRIRSGERQPGDFLILTPHTKKLAEYASALEHRNVPLQVTGAGVGAFDNATLAELRLLLRALADPADSALTVAVLVGLFFGLDYEQLVQHVEGCDAAGRSRPFAFTRRVPDDGVECGASPVDAALGTLNRWWRWTRREPSDVAVARIVRESGLLPFAAAGDLGESRAGALLWAQDAVRAAAVNGDATLHGAIEALDAALDDADGEAPLEPGRPGAVRLMNVHKAKGLEARVVVLAMPSGHRPFPPRRRIIRDGSGRALGYCTLGEERDGRPVVLAQPLDWDGHAAVEQQFQNAEEDRLLYVAATRAAEELVVAVADNPRSPSRWRSFHEWLRLHGTPLSMPTPTYLRRARLEQDAAAILGTAAAADAARAALGRPGYRAAPVTARKLELVSGVAAGPDRDGATGGEGAEATTGRISGRGTEWGTVVHDALLAAVHHPDAAVLRAMCVNLLVSHERPLQADGSPQELDELLRTVDAVIASPLWRRALAAEQRHVEVPFSVRFSAREYAEIAAGGSSSRGHAVASGAEEVSPPAEIIEGRIDLAFRDAAGWVIVDYKTDAAGAALPAHVRERYEAQLALYRHAWERITGEPVSETHLLFTHALETAP